MNENFVKNFEDATISFCNVFEECENKVSNYKDQIDKLEKEISENEQLYKLGNGEKAKDITPESVFMGLSDSEKIGLAASAQNDRVKAVDDAGNLITDYNSLNYETKQYFEEKVKQMRADRAGKKDEVDIAKSSIITLSAELRATVSENFANLVKEQLKFNSAIADIDTVKSDYDDEIRRCNRNKRTIKNDSRLTNEEKIQRTNEQEEKRKKAAAGKSVCTALDKVSDAYTEAFTKVMNSIDPSNAYYPNSIAGYLDKDNREKIVDELNILDLLNDLIKAFAQIENNYDEVKNLVGEIKSQTKEFSKKHGRGDEFVSAVNKATTAVSTAVKEVANANGVDLSQVQSQDSAQAQTPGQSQDPAQTQTPGQSQDPAQAQTPGQSQDPAQTQTPGQGQDPAQTQTSGQNGLSGSVADLTEKAIKIRSVRRCKAHDRELVTILAGVAACGLGLVTGTTVLPMVGVALTGMGAVFMTADAGVRLIDRIRMGCVNYKINKVAKKTTKLLRKGNKGSKIKVFAQPDENGVIKYYVKDGESLALVDSNLTADIEGQQLVDYMNDQLKKTFRYINDPEKKKDTRYENLPNVTVDELNAPYVEFGGYMKGLENRQYGMLGRLGANAKDTISKFADRFRREDVDAIDVADDDYENGLDDGSDSGDGAQQDADPVEEAVDRLMSYPDFAGIPRDSVSQIVGAFALNRDSFSDELKARIDELITNGTYSDANGNHVQMTSNELGMLLNDVQLFIQSQQQQQQTSQPTTAFDVSDAFATLSSKYGASYPADELQDKINEISMKYDSINNADLKRIVLEALTNGAYVAHGAVIDVTPTELDALVTAIDNDLGISGPTPQP